MKLEIEVTENRAKKGYTFYFNLKRLVFYHSNYDKFFYIVQITFMYVLPGNIQYSTLFHGSGVIEKEKAIPRTVRYLLESLI